MISVVTLLLSVGLTCALLAACLFLIIEGV